VSAPGTKIETVAPGAIVPRRAVAIESETEHVPAEVSQVTAVKNGGSDSLIATCSAAVPPLC
jgi:hypothetical protein